MSNSLQPHGILQARILEWVAIPFSSASMWNKRNFMIIWTVFALPFFGTGMKTDIFQSCDQCEFSKFADMLSPTL